MDRRDILRLATAAGLLVLTAGAPAGADSGEGAGPGSASTAARAATAPGGEKRPAFQVGVDARVELMSIIFALAGNPEYCRGRVGSYTLDAEKHFVAFKDHAVVQLARKLRARRGVSYDAPMSLAVHVTDASSLKEKVPFDPHPPGLDRRWRLEEVRDFLGQARRFAAETKFGEFFRAHRGLYDTSAERLKATMVTHARLEWFDRFFGKRPGASFHLVLGMLNGPCCYGVSVTVGNKQELYCILGVWRCDGEGVPEFPKSVLPTVVHEFCHAYCNPLVVAHAADLEKPGKEIFARVEDTMKRQAYATWRHMMYESLVRASVVRYRWANEGPLAAASEIDQQHKLGFAWVGELSNLLAAYETQRDKYPTLTAFMPRVVEFFNAYAARKPTGPAGGRPGRTGAADRRKDR